MWNATNDMVGQRVMIRMANGRKRRAEVIGVSTVNANIRVRTTDGRIMVGNDWEEA